jgi:hypothetical protein
MSFLLIEPGDADVRGVVGRGIEPQRHPCERMRER